MTQKALAVKVGSAVRAYRKRNGLTISRLADMADIDAGFLSHVERGTRMASLPMIASLADALGISLSQLFKNASSAPKDLKGITASADRELIAQLKNLFQTKKGAEREDMLVVLRKMRNAAFTGTIRKLIER